MLWTARITDALCARTLRSLHTTQDAQCDCDDINALTMHVQTPTSDSSQVPAGAPCAVDIDAIARLLHARESRIIAGLRVRRRWQHIVSIEDLLQDVYCDLLTRRPHAERLDSLLSWMRGRVRRRLVESQHRLSRPSQSSRRQAPMASLAARPDPRARGPAHVLEGEQRIQTLKSHVARLPEEHQTVLRLCLGSDMSYREVADHFDRSPDWVADTVRSALLLLRRRDRMDRP